MLRKKLPKERPTSIGATFFLFSLLLSSFSALAGETKKHEFAVMKDGDEVGRLTVTEIPTPSQTNYQYAMDLTTSVLFKKIHVEYSMDAVYKRGMLISYHLLYKLNDKVVDDIDLSWDGKKYLITTTGGTEEHLRKITLSTIRLFCKEPLGRTEVWGEKYCEPAELRLMKAGQYRVLFGSSKYNDFYYKDGKLVRVSINNALMSFEMFRVD